MSVLTDTASYPITPATARHLERPLPGHVIDGEVVPSLDGATMPIIDPDGWKISRLVLNLLRGEAKTDAAGYLELVRRPGPGEGRVETHRMRR